MVRSQPNDDQVRNLILDFGLNTTMRGPEKLVALFQCLL